MSNGEKFENRVFGAVLVKAITANYNADFTGSPRTLPNGVVYATDKALKYCIRNYLKQDNKTIFYITRHKKENMQPLDMDETYEAIFGKYPVTIIDFNKTDKNGKSNIQKEIEKEDYAGYSIKEQTESILILSKENEKDIVFIDSDDKKRKIVLKNILTSMDIRLFGATYASQEKVKINGKEQKITFSIHGNVQITHGLNIYEENNIFSEDITSPFRNSSDSSDDSMQTTIGNQTVLEEGHYLHNFTINPRNTKELVELIDNKGYLTNNDIEKFKEAINKGVTYLDSASKAGVENEFSIFITLDEKSKIQLPSFTTLVKIEKQNGFKRKLDLSKIKELLNEEILKEKIAKVEIFLNEYALDYDDEIFDIQNVCVKSIVSDKELQKCQK
ncbi:MAG: type I CRISPR-associated protein Cas7 [Sulfurovum sp.]|nr:type I CRISPR-associated protein Cas7 [Sulfurovum sp.]